MATKPKKRWLGFSWRYLLAFLIMLAAIIAIALFITTGFIRNHFGDILIVILIYCGVKIFICQYVKWLPLYIFIFATLVEVGQYFNLVYLLGLADFPLARIAIGMTFDWWDIVMYFIGCVLLYCWDLVVQKRAVVSRF